MEPSNFDLYRVVIQDTQALKSQRDRVDSIHISLISLALVADGYIIGSIPLDRLQALVGTIIIGLVGLAFTLRSLVAYTSLSEVLKLRYEILRNLEKSMLATGRDGLVFTQEYQRFYRGNDADRPKRGNPLAILFFSLFAVPPIGLGALLILAQSFPAIDQFLKNPLLH